MTGSLPPQCKNCVIQAIPNIYGQRISTNIYVDLEEWKGHIYIDACHGKDYEMIFGRWDHEEYKQAQIICTDGRRYRVFIK